MEIMFDNHMVQNDIFELDSAQIEAVSGGFVCGGLCILGAIAGGTAILAGGIAIGEAIHDAFHEH